MKFILFYQDITILLLIIFLIGKNKLIHNQDMFSDKQRVKYSANISSGRNLFPDLT